MAYQQDQIERLRAALRGLLMLFDTNKHPQQENLSRPPAPR